MLFHQSHSGLPSKVSTLIKMTKRYNYEPQQRNLSLYQITPAIFGSRFRTVEKRY